MSHVPSHNERQTVAGQFDFLPVDKVIFGPGKVQTLPSELERLEANRVLLLTTPSVSRTPLLARIVPLLGDRCAAVWAGSQQFTPSKTVDTLVQLFEQHAADLIVTLGGGSVIDAAKAAIWEHARGTGIFLNHISLPTTLSASEFSSMFGVTDERTKNKSGARHPRLAPLVVILDAQLTEHTPDWLWLASGIRALDHAVETVYAPDHQPATDAPALEAIRLLFTYLPHSTGGNSKQNARQQCQIAAWMSFFGIANITLGLSHTLGRELGPRYNIPHGNTSAILLPKVMAHFQQRLEPRLALIAVASGTSSADRADAATLAGLAPQAVHRLVKELGLPQTLRHFGVPREDLVDLAAERTDVLTILEAAW